MAVLKNALVTGASRGIGEAIAVKLAEEGFSVTCAARSLDALNSVVMELPLVYEGQTHHVWQVDLSDVEAAAKFDGAPLPARSYDVLVNNAGASDFTPLTAQSVETQQHMIAVNLLAPIALTRAFVTACAERPRYAPVHVVFTSSVAALRGVANLAVYTATKSGIDGFMRALARELGPKSIHVNSVVPGAVDTEMNEGVPIEVFGDIPIKGWIDVGAIADAVAFLVKSKNITGSSLVIDNGLSV